MKNEVLEKFEHVLRYDEKLDSYISKNYWVVKCPNKHIFKVFSSQNLNNDIIRDSQCPICSNIEINSTISIISKPIDESISKINLQLEKGEKILAKDIKIKRSDFDLWHKNNMDILNIIFYKTPIVKAFLDFKYHIEDPKNYGYSKTIDYEINEVKKIIKVDIYKLELIKKIIKNIYT